MTRDAREPLSLIHVLDVEWGWCFAFSDRQVGYARLSDLEADTDSEQAVPSQTAGPTITDEDLAAVIDDRPR